MSPKQRAINLRLEGYSYSQIMKQTGLSKSTLSYHLSGIKYEPNEATLKKITLAQNKSAYTKRRKKEELSKQICEEVREEIGILTRRDVLMLGIGLYLGEGSKTNEIVRLVNTDPRALRLFIRWLKLFGIQKENIMMRIHAYPETNIKEAEQYWLKQLSLTSASLQTPYIDGRLGGSVRKKGIHPYGTAHLTVKALGNKQFGVRLFRKISAYFNEVLE